ncbi:MAG: DUF3365 domain-containing protein [FCB group bacterium]|nr:DUF3365 domain-containing protein [FCB group bacterium]
MNKQKIKIILLIVAVTVTACEIKDDRVTIPDPKEAVGEIKLGHEVAGELAGELRETLLNSIDASGFVNTITICNQWAPVYAQRVVEKYDGVTAIKRTAFRVRNPADTPDKYEKEALLYYNEKIQMGEDLPEYYIQRIIQAKKVFYRYYEPIVMGGICLHCHGEEKNINPEILKKINQLYPADSATGYQDKDFRGLISVTLDQQPEN